LLAEIDSDIGVRYAKINDNKSQHPTIDSVTLASTIHMVHTIQYIIT